MTAERKAEQHTCDCCKQPTATAYEHFDFVSERGFNCLPTESETERENEPEESSWVRCATCGHDMYVHMHIGYGGCLYGEGCECQQFRNVPAPSETPSPEVDAERELRNEWWLNHGCSLIALYGDDGEMQCNNGRLTHPPLDFRRDPLPELKRWVNAGRMARGERAIAAAGEQSK